MNPCSNAANSEPKIFIFSQHRSHTFDPTQCNALDRSATRLPVHNPKPTQSPNSSPVGHRPHQRNSFGYRILTVSAPLTLHGTMFAYQLRRSHPIVRQHVLFQPLLCQFVLFSTDCSVFAHVLPIRATVCTNV